MRLDTKIIPATETRSTKVLTMLNEVVEVLRDNLKYKRMVEVKRELYKLGITYLETNDYSPKFRLYKRLTGETLDIAIYARDRNFSSPAEVLPLILEEIPRYFETNEGYEPSLYNTQREIENTFSGEMTKEKFLNTKENYVKALRELADKLEESEIA